MAAAFAEDGIRVTPSGIFHGRDVALTPRRARNGIARLFGPSHAKLSDQPPRGFYTAIIVREGDRATIMEETVTIAAPGQ
jgi:hypothetical protein